MKNLITQDPLQAAQHRIRQSTYQLREKLDKNILILDGAMGTLVQHLAKQDIQLNNLCFEHHQLTLNGDCDLLALLRPQMLVNIHRSYLQAGADIIKTNTFNANRVDLSKFNLQSCARTINLESAKLARQIADEYYTPQRPRFVAGVIGPTHLKSKPNSHASKTPFPSPEYDFLIAAYKESCLALLEGGADFILIETIYDLNNARAAIKAVNQCSAQLRIDVPFMLSATLPAQNRQPLSQWVNNFYHAFSDYKPLAMGFNCTADTQLMQEALKQLAHISTSYVGVYPNAGLPDKSGHYPISPRMMAETLSGLAEIGLLNIVGGCCGTSPAHIKVLANKLRSIRT